MKLKYIYWYNNKVPFTDFNKEIYHPGVNPNFPNGVIGIRVDDNFWEVAALPYCYKNIPTEYIIKLLWPKLKNYTVHPDYIAQKDDFKPQWPD